MISFVPEGTNKIGKACPAGFRVKKYEDGKIVVEAFLTHFGHSQAVGDIFLTEEDREQIAGRHKIFYRFIIIKTANVIFLGYAISYKLSVYFTGKLQEGVEIERILSDIRNSATVGRLRRIHILERKDILNIKQRLGELNETRKGIEILVKYRPVTQ